jgi:hypothetical protein
MNQLMMSFPFSFYLFIYLFIIKAIISGGHASSRVPTTPPIGHGRRWLLLFRPVASGRRLLPR